MRLVAPLVALILTAFVACDDPIETIELRQVGTLRAHVTLPAPAAAVRVDVTSWLPDRDGQLVEHTATRQLTPPDRDAYALFALTPGDHHVVAVPLDADARPLAGCDRAEDTATINGPGVVTLGLAPTCEAAPAPES